MKGETPIDYIDVMARWLIVYAYELWVEDHGWESVPDIGEHDFDRLCTHAEGLLPKSPSIREYKEAYDTFEVRAAVKGDTTWHEAGCSLPGDHLADCFVPHRNRDAVVKEKT